MNDERDRFFNDSAERAFGNLRQTRVPAGPSEELVSKTLARLRAGDGREEMAARKGWWTVKKVKAVAWTSGAGIAAAVGMMWLVYGFGGTMAFAQVEERVRSATAVRCKVTVEVWGWDSVKPPTAQEWEVLVVPPDWYIERSNEWRLMVNVKEGKVMKVEDTPKSTMVFSEAAPNGAANTRPLELPPELQGTVTVATITNYKDGGRPALPHETMNVFELFKSIEGEGKPVGERNMGGIATKGFSFNADGNPVTVWVDPKTRLPVEIYIDRGMWTHTAGVQLVYHDFQWNPKVDPRELSFEIPKGAIKLESNINITATSEKDLSETLKVVAQMNKGIFPDHFTMPELAGIWKEQQAQVRQQLETFAAGLRKNRPTAPADIASAEKAYRGLSDAFLHGQENMLDPLRRAVDFMNYRDHGTDWTYGGKGVKFGDAERAIFWYRTPTGGWRVMRGDLSIRDAGSAPGAGEALKFEGAKLPTTEGETVSGALGRVP